MSAVDLSKLKIYSKDEELSKYRYSNFLFVYSVILSAVVIALLYDKFFSVVPQQVQRTSSEISVLNQSKQEDKRVIRAEVIQEEACSSEVSCNVEEGNKDKGTLASSGYVVAQRKAAVSAKITGKLRELYVREGDSVKQGQVIGIIDNEDLLANVNQSLAVVSSAKAQILVSEVELRDARRQMDRISKLSSEKVISQADFDVALTRVDKALANMELAKANLLVSESQAAKAKIDFDNSSIKAPFDGRVLNKNADIGEIVTPFGAGLEAKSAVVTVADMDSLEVEADVSESNIANVKLGQKAFIALDSLPGSSYKGYVKSIIPVANRAKATVMVKIKILDASSGIIPEMSAKVILELQD